METSDMQIPTDFTMGAPSWAFSLAVSVAGLGRRVPPLKH